MAADLFETYVVTVVATMVLASIFFTGDFSNICTPNILAALANACLNASSYCLFRYFNYYDYE